MDARYALELLEEVNREIWKDPIRQFDISLDTARAAGIFAARHVMAVPQLIAGGAGTTPSSLRILIRQAPGRRQLGRKAPRFFGSSTMP